MYHDPRRDAPRAKHAFAACPQQH
ncbi:hypothetical protein BN1708_004234 [Verticillium longisporum]|uniref:Uncharacterized protein n=1 Tax=Verticillium longisporum TaxID=100787 RepID=A0A0G4LWP9_VERLO|nr:hypothetical protein BN1708_004234 [Verticillium longisporum]